MHNIYIIYSNPFLPSPPQISLEFLYKNIFQPHHLTSPLSNPDNHLHPGLVP